MTKDVLFDNMISWIWEHSYDIEDFVSALKQCGFTEEQIQQMAKDEGWEV